MFFKSLFCKPFSVMDFSRENVPVALVELNAADFIELEQHIKNKWLLKHRDKLSYHYDHTRDHELIHDAIRKFLDERRICDESHWNRLVSHWSIIDMDIID